MGEEMEKRKTFKDPKTCYIPDKTNKLFKQAELQSIREEAKQKRQERDQKVFV